MTQRHLEFSQWEEETLLFSALPALALLFTGCPWWLIRHGDLPTVEILLRLCVAAIPSVRTQTSPPEEDVTVRTHSLYFKDSAPRRQFLMALFTLEFLCILSEHSRVIPDPHFHLYGSSRAIVYWLLQRMNDTRKEGGQGTPTLDRVAWKQRNRQRGPNRM